MTTSGVTGAAIKAGRRECPAMMEDSTKQRTGAPSLPDEWIAMMAGDESQIILAARIVRIEDNCAWFDVGSKFESSIPLADWSSDESPPQIDDEFPVMIDDDRDVDDRPLKIMRVELRHIPRNRIWEKIVTSIEPGQTYTGRITRKIRDGFLVDIGVNVFLPDECAVPAMLADPDAFVDHDVTCRVTSIDHDRRSIRISLQ